MRILLLAVILLPLRLFAAAGDPLGAWVSTNGWDLFITYSGMSTGGTYQLGLGQIPGLTNVHMSTTLSNPSARLTFDTQGWKDGVSVIKPWLSVGTVPVLMPNNGTDTFYDEHMNGSHVVVRIALSDKVYAGDSNLSLTLRAGLYNQGGTDSAAGSLSVTNNSVFSYKGAIANWTRSAWHRWTNTIEKVGVYGKTDVPLDCVEVVITTTNVVTTNRVFTPTIDHSRATLGSKRPEYIAYVDNGSLSNGASVRVDFIAKPSRGDTNAVLNTFRGEYVQPTTKPASVTNVVDWDRTRTYSNFRCVVAAGGSDVNGRATNCAVTDVSSSHYFATFAGALTFGAASNNVAHGHNDIGGLEIYGQSSVSNWSGGTISVTTVPRARAIVRPYPGHRLIFDRQTGDRDAADRVEFISCEFRGEENLFANTEQMKWTSCIISNNHFSVLLQQCEVVWAEACQFHRMPEGIRGYGTQNTAYNLWGCDLNTFNNQIGPRFMMGCVSTGMQGRFKIDADYTSSTTPPNLDYLIYEGNYIGGLILGGSSVLSIGDTVSLDKGCLIENNVFECVTNNIAAAFSFFSNGSVATTNANLINNTVVGKRSAGMFYNDSGSNPVWRINCSVRNCIYDNTGWKSWDFVGATNAGRIGNLSVMYGVDCGGNIYEETWNADNEGAGSFAPYFPGLYSFHPPGTSLASGTNTLEWIKFMGRRYQGQMGGGDYRLQSDSPAFKISATGQVGADVALVTGAPVFDNPEGFELGWGDWSTDRGTWQVGVPTVGPPPNAQGRRAFTGTNCAATVLNGNYSYGQASRLISPAFTVPPAASNPRLRFWHWYSFAGSSGGGRVQIKQGTNDWVSISPEYAQNRGGVWTRPLIDLSAYAGKQVQLGFYFTAPPASFGGVDVGWYVDEIRLTHDFVLLLLDSPIVRTQNTACVPLGIAASSPASNVSFTLQSPSGHLGNLTLNTEGCWTGSVTPQPDSQWLITLQNNCTSAAMGVQTVGSICFTAVSTESAFVALSPNDLVVANLDGSTPRTLPFGSRTIIVADKPLLEAWLGSNGQRMMTTYGKADTAYEISQATNVIASFPWAPGWTNTVPPGLSVNSPVQGVLSNTPILYLRATER